MNDKINLLNVIKAPDDLKNLTPQERSSLAKEMRERIIETVSKTGGHLASNLGVVELTIALHTVYETPKDKIVWDVGHQCYPHKLLTGRQESFCYLRKCGGASGFPKREESEHDAFGAGHASTSISAALGLAKARDILGGDESIIAVIGDGALTGGLALEGMNNAEPLNTDIVVVLNDNNMSISEPVGAMALHLSKLRIDPRYQTIENKAKQMMKKIPAGRTLSWTAEGISHGVTRLLSSKTAVLFEELGFTYIGPIDGHNTDLLIEVFNSVKKLKGPVLVHILTTKGKGYQYAEENAKDFHGISGFDVEDGKIEPSSGYASYTKAFSEAIVELAKEDEKIVAITAAMPDGTGLSKFAKEFPDRFFDVGIAEEHAVTFAAGLAARGLKPVVAIYSTFLQRSYDQIVHDVCLQGLNVVFAIDRAGIVGEDGPTHHGVFDISYLRHIPRMVIGCPSDTNELRNMLATALKYDGPMAIRYPRGAGPCEYEPRNVELLNIGKGKKIKDGNDLSIIAIGSMVCPSMQTAEILEKSNIKASVYDAKFAKPVDEQIVRECFSISKPIVIIEDNTIVGGFGSAVIEMAVEMKYPVNRVLRLGIPDNFIEHDTAASLKEKLGLTPQKIVESIEIFLKENNKNNISSDSEKQIKEIKI